MYAEKQIDKAMELGKTAAITYWEGYDQEAKNILALAREAALNSELYHPQPMPRIQNERNLLPGYWIHRRESMPAKQIRLRPTIRAGAEALTGALSCGSPKKPKQNPEPKPPNRIKVRPDTGYRLQP